MGIFSDNYYSWLDRQNAKSVMDEESMAEHDKHYHPNGYNPDTDRCGRRETEKDRDSVSEESPPFTEKTLQDRFGIKVRPFSQDLGDAPFALESFKEGWEKYTTAPNEAQRKQTISRVGKVLDDLEKRFGCKIKIDNLLIAEMKPHESGQFIGGFSLADRIATKESVIVVPTNPPKWGGETYGHDDDRNVDDMIRHEVGHALTTREVIKSLDDFQTRLSEKWDNHSINLMMAMWGSQYGLKSKDLRETIAEIFSRVTDSSYQFGRVPKELEKMVVGSMLGVDYA